VTVSPGQGLYIPISMRHRLRNTGSEEAFAVFQLGPLAPRPDLGHVDTEATEVAEATGSAER
jgi:mannose-6-phosphate isomerase-like protein (cupin superfamily)